MRLVMMGTGTFAEPTFEALLASDHPVVGLVTQPDRAVGHERSTTRQTGRGMKTLAQEKGVPIYQPEKINTPEGIDTLRSWNPDLLVVAAYGQILSSEVLATASRGGINVHASLLPKYRGAAPVAWAIYHGETETGVTIIQMSPRLDAGGMLLQESLAIGEEETAGELESRLSALGAKMALQGVLGLEKNQLHPKLQNSALVSKAPKLKKEDGLINWSRSAREVCRQIRAMQPWPTAYSYFQSGAKDPVRIVVTRARPTESESSLPPGYIAPTPGILNVAAGDKKWVEVLELQPAGKRRMAAADFLRGHAIREGDRLLVPW